MNTDPGKRGPESGPVDRAIGKNTGKPRVPASFAVIKYYMYSSELKGVRKLFNIL